jgi:NTE family protein
MKDRALVLGGGGVAGIAWMTGLLAGLNDHHVELRSAEIMIGTSAGSTLGAQLGSRRTLEELFRRMVDPSEQTREIQPEASRLESFREAVLGFAAVTDRAERIRQVGNWALAVATVAESVRRQVVAGRLPSHCWPDFDLRIVAIDAHSAQTVVFDRGSSVDLVDAVAASCAVPGIWPPVTIQGRRYMDGGVRSPDNADFARGYRRIVVVSPVGTTHPRIGGGGLKEQIEALELAGGQAYCVHPDGESKRAIGLNPLAPETRAPAAKAGRRQGQAMAGAMAAFWNDPGR